MTDAVIISVATALPILLTQFVQLYLSKRNGQKTDAVVAEVAKVKNEAEVISGHVNSAATAAAAKIDALEKQIVEMRNSMAEKKELAALLAQSKATGVASSVAVPTPVGEPLPVIVTNPASAPVPTTNHPA